MNFFPTLSMAKKAVYTTIAALLIITTSLYAQEVYASAPTVPENISVSLVYDKESDSDRALQFSWNAPVDQDTEAADQAISSLWITVRHGMI